MSLNDIWQSFLVLLLLGGATWLIILAEIRYRQNLRGDVDKSHGKESDLTKRPSNGRGNNE